MSAFGAFLHSSLSCAGHEVVTSQIQGFLADTVAHFGLAIILTTLMIYRGWPIWMFWAGLAAIVAKEFAFDLPNGGWTVLVTLDSAWDVASWFAGFLFQWWFFAERNP